MWASTESGAWMNPASTCKSCPTCNPARRAMIGKPVFQITSDGPGIVDHPVALAQDRHHVLAAQRADRRNIGEADQAEFDRHALMGERIADPPGERTRPTVAMAEALIHDEAHRSSLPYRLADPSAFSAGNAACRL